MSLVWYNERLSRVVLLAYSSSMGLIAIMMGAAQGGLV